MVGEYASTEFDSLLVTARVGSLNEAPIADAVCEQLTSIGSQALVRLDGSGSSDAEDATIDLLFDWTVTDLSTMTSMAYTGMILEQNLDYGSYQVTLRVTDSAGEFSDVTKNIVIDPAVLSSLSLDKVKVDWEHDPSKVKHTGEIGRPTG